MLGARREPREQNPGHLLLWQVSAGPSSPIIMDLPYFFEVQQCLRIVPQAGCNCCLVGGPYCAPNWPHSKQQKSQLTLPSCDCLYAKHSSKHLT